MDGVNTLERRCGVCGVVDKEGKYWMTGEWLCGKHYIEWNDSCNKPSSGKFISINRADELMKDIEKSMVNKKKKCEMEIVHTNKSTGEESVDVGHINKSVLKKERSKLKKGMKKRRSIGSVDKHPENQIRLGTFVSEGDDGDRDSELKKLLNGNKQLSLVEYDDVMKSDIKRVKWKER